MGRWLGLGGPDSFRFHDRPSPIFVGAGSDSDVFVERGGAEGLGRGLEVIEERNVGTPLDSEWRDALSGGNHTPPPRGFRVFFRLALRPQAAWDFANGPIGPGEHVALHTFDSD